MAVFVYCCFRVFGMRLKVGYFVALDYTADDRPDWFSCMVSGKQENLMLAMWFVEEKQLQ